MKSKIWPRRPRKWTLDLNDLGRRPMDFFKNYNQMFSAVRSGGGWLFFKDLLNEWVAKGIAFDPHDFTMRSAVDTRTGKHRWDKGTGWQGGAYLYWREGSNAGIFTSRTDPIFIRPNIYGYALFSWANICAKNRIHNLSWRDMYVRGHYI